MISILLSSRWLGFHKRFKVAAYRTRVILWSLFCLDPIAARMQMPEVDDLNPPIFEAAARRRCLQLARSAIGTTQLLLFGVQSISEVDADKWFVPNDPRVMPRRNRPHIARTVGPNSRFNSCVRQVLQKAFRGLSRWKGSFFSWFK